MYRVRSHKLNNGSSNVDFIRSPNIGGALQPRFLVIHYTASGPNSDIANYFSGASAKVSAHLVIRRDGTIKQCVPFNVVAWHAGRSRFSSKDGNTYTGLNQNSIGIEIENWGPLDKSGGGWVSWTGSSVDPTRVIEAKHKNGGPVRGWEPFTEAQITATIDASQAICSSYNINEIVGHDDISTIGKIDPGPAWNMNSFRSKVLGRESNDSDTLVVRSATGLNIRKSPNSAGELVRATPLQDGTLVILHEREGRWCFVSVLNSAGLADFSGWVHGSFLSEA